MSCGAGRRRTTAGGATFMKVIMRGDSNEWILQVGKKWGRPQPR
jgi:hypothetical protein